MGSGMGSITRRQLTHSRPVLSRSRHTLTTLRQQPRFYRRDNAEYIEIHPPIENSSNCINSQFRLII